jgi:hypothetical protein
MERRNKYTVFISKIAEAMNECPPFLPVDIEGRDIRTACVKKEVSRLHRPWV